ncbi:MAG: DUF2267 domain-containing protein [Ardenticatenaceae bacterium]|nr:DUF2267 domain-containing protein [Ardenticatenaceae bacterium]MCB9444339.1 DUF2267 domain-containing protein [Ardenticatenaceae bacterium]
MDELVKMVAKETGLPEAQARKAAEAVIKFLKTKLPEPLAGQVDNFLGNEGTADAAQDLLQKGLGFLGKK